MSLGVALAQLGAASVTPATAGVVPSTATNVVICTSSDPQSCRGGNIGPGIPNYVAGVPTFLVYPNVPCWIVQLAAPNGISVGSSSTNVQICPYTPPPTYSQNDAIVTAAGHNASVSEGYSTGSARYPADTKSKVIVVDGATVYVSNIECTDPWPYGPPSPCQFP